MPRRSPGCISPVRDLSPAVESADGRAGWQPSAHCETINKSGLGARRAISEYPAATAQRGAALAAQLTRSAPWCLQSPMREVLEAALECMSVGFPSTARRVILRAVRGVGIDFVFSKTR